jgi:hypothetical protein
MSIEPTRATFDKLNLKDQTDLVVLNAPESFERELKTLDGREIRRKVAGSRPVVFAIAFVKKQAEIDQAAKTLVPRLEGDVVLWFAYPKGSSKRYTCDFNRDTGWTVLGEAGFEPVRMVAIDEDWSAIRFRRVAFIKTMTRGKEHTFSTEGRRKAGAAKKR